MHGLRGEPRQADRNPILSGQRPCLRIEFLWETGNAELYPIAASANSHRRRQPRSCELAGVAEVPRGHTVQIAYSSVAALEQAEVYQADVVLLDIGLPDMDGFELATRLRELLPSAMFMAVSGHAGDAFRAKARAVGIEEYFIKPVAVAKLREVLDGMAKRT